MKLLSFFINALLTITTAKDGPDGHNDEMNLERRRVQTMDIRNREEHWFT